MRKEACTASGGIYRPRHPRASPLHQCVTRHYDELEAGGHFIRRVEEQVLTRFLDCGDLHQGFAWVYCDGCGHDYLLAFSCKARYFCPSCHQKRMLAYGEWVDENVLAPVPHRQYVFALPKLLRPYFRQHREYLGTLCRIIAQLLYQGFKAMAPDGRPGFILYVQTFGDLVTFNPHVTARDGGNAGNAGAITCHALDRVLQFLCNEAGFDPRLAEHMRKGEHSGFSVHNQIRVTAGDAEGRKQLARYMIRTPLRPGEDDLRQQNRHGRAGTRNSSSE